MEVAASVSPVEIARFDALAAQWWDPRGPMRALHAMNPLRVGWIDRRIARPDTRPVRLLDVGCGAGIAAEAFARLGHDVTGVDAAGRAIAAAQAHAAASRAAGETLALRYHAGLAEALLAGDARFDAVTALEVIEHVPEPAAFLRTLSALTRPGGTVFVSTLNRTLRSFAMAKLGAEYVLRLLPAGTHDWRRFVTPAELAAHGRTAGLRVAAASGMVLDLKARAWREDRDLGVNYIAALRRD